MAYKPFKSRNVNQLAKETPVISNVLDDLARNCRDQTKKLTDFVYEQPSDSDVGDSLCGEGVNVIHLESHEFVDRKTLEPTLDVGKGDKVVEESQESIDSLEDQMRQIEVEA